MGYKDNYENEDKRLRDEYKNNPGGNLNDGFRNADIGNLSQIGRNGCLVNVLIVVTLIIIYIFIAK
ncbi:MAG: DUF6366 family protein [Clostridium sp.]